MSQQTGGGALAPLYRALDALPEPLRRLGHHWFVFLVLVGVPAWALYGGLLGYGLPLLLRDDPSLFEGRENARDLAIAFLNSPSFFTHLSVTFFTGMFWILAAVMDDRDDERFTALTLRQEIAYILIRTIPISIIMILLACFPAEGTPRVMGGELIRCVAGAILGLILISVFSAASETIAKRLKWRRRFVLFGMLVSIIAILHLWPKLLPIVSIYKIAITIAAAYFLMNFFREGTRAWVFLAIVGLPLFIGSLGGFKYSFSGMDAFYDCPVILKPRRLGLPEQPTLMTDCKDKTVGDPPSRYSPRAALLKFAERKKREGALGPRLVVVASSGGAYRATFWTALVLDRLNEMSRAGNMRGFAEHIRLLTGASGGMIAAGYFAVPPAENSGCPEPQSLVCRIEKDIEAQQAKESAPPHVALPRDSLSSVFQQLAVNDILHIGMPGSLDLGGLWKGPFKNDRGRVLQNYWKSLDRPFSWLKDEVAAGKAPSIIFFADHRRDGPALAA